MIHNLDVLNKLVDKKLLIKCETEDLAQYNYSDYTNVEGYWNKYTLFNRGNVYDKTTGELVGKCLPKFFEMEQLPQSWQDNLRTQSFEATKKYDGVMGVIYKFQNTVYCNTRNSFNNNITKLMYSLLPNYNLDILDILNIVVEVISPQTRDIVDYGDTVELRLVTAFYKVTGAELSYNSLYNIALQIGMPIVENVDLTWHELTEYQNNADCTSEGYVLRFAGNLRVKIKNQAYLNAKTVKDKVNIHSMWKLFNSNVGINEIHRRIMQYSSPMYETSLEVFNKLVHELTLVKSCAKDIHENTKLLSDKQLSEYFEQNKTKYEDMVWAYRKNDSERVHRIALRLIEP